MLRFSLAALVLLLLVLGCDGGDPLSKLLKGGSDDNQSGPPNGVETELVSEDSFASGPLDSTKWALLDDTRGRTDFFNLLSFSEGVATLNFDTYNQDDFFSRMSGSGIIGTQSHAVGNGLILQARIRLPSDTGGVVAEAGFMGDNGSSYNSVSAAYLGNQGVSTLLAQVWQNESKTAPDYTAADRVSSLKSQGGFSRRNWHILEVRYLGATAEWHLDGQLVYAATVAFTPLEMKAWLRIWAPETGWSQGYNANLTPAVNPFAAVRYPLEVDWVKVYRISP